MIRGQGETERKEVLKLGSWEDGKRDMERKEVMKL
jgi:hypothetical protein